MPEPSTQIRTKVHYSGVGETDLKISRGELTSVMSLPQPAVRRYETAGTVARVGDEVAAWPPSLGGYGEHALAENWAVKPLT
jgi:D-arabinose 1-dehydrogenase-like Zn-dependent alcohol dehydrogenase